MRLFQSIIALAIAVLPNVAFAQVSNDNVDGVFKVDRHDHRTFRQGEVIVKFKTGSTMSSKAKSASRTSAVNTVSAVMAELGATDIQPLMPLTGELKKNAAKTVRGYNGKEVEVKDMSSLYTVRFDESKQQDVHSAIEKLQALDDVEYAEPNYLVYTTTATGDGDIYKKDPLYNNNGHWGITGINIYNLWNTPKITTKRPVIAILDTGVDITHPDLAANIWTNKLENDGVEGKDDDANGFKDDIHGWDFVNNSPRMRDNNGHGTHCAGIAAAVGGNGIGACGVNPDAWIMPVTVMQSDGTGDVATIIKGIDYAVANGADVISMSFGGYSHSAAEEQALAHAYATAILVAAAGNDGYCMNHARCNQPKGIDDPMPMFPAAYTFVLGVQASYSNGGLAGFSNYDDDGPFYSEHGEDKLYNYELTAPGVKIISTFPNGQYKELSGTSMACPAVAGAISRLMQCKELGSKEELFGDLINSKTANGNLDIYKAYQMSDANRKPTLSLITYNMDDAAGDGDGRADAGETIDIYPVLRNQWGSAKNIRVSIELAETEDPEIVQIINGTADFGFDLSSYAKSTSANPLRIKINDNCADGRHICLVLKATCDNITEDAKQDVMVVAENGVELKGLQTEDITLLSRNHYILSGDWGIVENTTVTIEPGTIIDMKGYKISNTGTIICEGEPGNMIKINGPGSFIAFAKGQISYTFFNNFNDDIFRNNRLVPLMIKNCVFKNIDRPIIYLSAGTPTDTVRIEKCNIYDRYKFDNKCCGIITTGSTLKASNKYNNIVGLQVDEYYSPNGIIDVNTNHYSNLIGNEYNIYFNTNTPQSFTPKKHNYFGTLREDIARYGILDMLNPVSPRGFGIYSLENMATKPFAEAHGLVWKVVVNGKDAQDEFEELAPLGVGTHKFEVYFNRPMNKAVAPTISMGVRVPYTSISIAEEGENSGWNEAGDIYTAYLTINGKTNAEGLNRIRVYGAEDDEYFEIPEEKYRFNVMVQKAGSMSTGLMAEAGLGKVSLTWETAEEDFADLMGYNIYRYEDDPEKATQINETLVDATETEFVDYDVVPGTTYYYMVKEMGTDLMQHDVSNVVAATPLTAQKGDANGSMSVDVADVVTEVNYLTNQNPQPFIFEAADVNSDNAVNILDVVGTVNIIMTPAAGTASVDNTAMFTVENGILYVDATTPLGGIQVSVAAPSGTEFEVLEGLDGMERAGNWMNNNEYQLLAYSMSGKTIGIGKQPLLRIGDTSVTSLVASDAKGSNVLAVNGAVTSINELPFGIEDFQNAEMRYYDLSGRMISAKTAQQKGIHIQSLYIGGRCVKSYKVIK